MIGQSVAEVGLCNDMAVQIELSCARFHSGGRGGGGVIAFDPSGVAAVRLLFLVPALYCEGERRE